MIPTQLQPNDPPMLRAAFGDLGLKETAGPAATARIVQMYAKAGHPEIKSDEVAWCAAAMGAWAVESGFAGTNSLAARSYLNWGQPLDIRKPLPRGAVLIFRRGNSAWQGHVCQLLKDDGATLLVIGANQNNSVSIARFSRAALIGARKPLTLGNSNVVRFFGGGIASEGAAHAAGGGADVLAQASMPDQVTGALTQAQEAAMQAATYLKVAQYALVAIGFALAAYGIYRYMRAWLKPKPLPDIEPGEAAVDLLPLEDEPPVKAKPRRRRQPKSRRLKRAGVRKSKSGRKRAA